jgi:6-phosphogluconolactonase (cycloisomerase 2 family)
MASSRRDAPTLAFIGRWDMYRSGTGNGFGICAYDAATGAMTAIGSALPDVTVGAACLHPSLPVLYCTDESKHLPGFYRGGGGQVLALAIEPETGTLTEICRQPSLGALPCHLAVDATGDYLIVVHHTDRDPVTRVVRAADGEYRIALLYDDASTVLFPLRPDGSIGAANDVCTHAGDGGPLPRQTHPQLHSVTMSPSGRLFAVCDKGNDELVFFTIDRAAGRLQRRHSFRSLPGSSPRYVAFHPTRPWLFMNHETQALVSALAYDEDGRCESVCATSALPAGVQDHPDMKQSDIRVHPSGRYVYSLIRGISAVSVFAVDERTGALARIQTVGLDGTGPRGCAVSSDGRFLHIAAHTSNELLCWAVGADGRLSPTGQRTMQPNAGSITFY